MSKFKVGDIVKRTFNANNGLVKGGIYTVSKVIGDEIQLRGFNISTFSSDFFELVKSESVSEYPSNFTEPHIYIQEKNNQVTPPPMNYFHTAVLIKKPITSRSTSSEIEWEELEPYKVRTAKSREDLEKILLRELDKSVDHNNVRFLINPIF